MRKIICTLVALLMLLPATVFASEFDDAISACDAAFDKGIEHSFEFESIEHFKEAVDYALVAEKLEPDNYEALWRVGRACRFYTSRNKWFQPEGWEDISHDYGKIGMKAAKKGMDINPDRPDAHFWYAGNIGSYAEGVSVIRAIKEGLKDKIQDNLHETAKIDASYSEYNPYLGLGRYYQLVAWPFKDKKKARKYLEKFHEHNDDPEGTIYLGELLTRSKKKTDRIRGKEMLEEYKDMDIPYFKEIIDKGLAKKI